MTRIVLLNSSLSPAAGGLASSVSLLARHLSRLPEADIHVVGTLDRADPKADAESGALVRGHQVVGPKAFHFSPGFDSGLKRLSPDVVDAQGLWTYPSLASLRYHRRTGRPYMVTPHGMLDPWALRRAHWKKRLVSLWFQDTHLRHAACLRATSEMEAGYFRDLGLLQPIAVIPNGVEAPPLLRRTKPGRAPKRLLFLSRLHPKKGLPYLMKAWARIAPEMRDWELVVAGPDEVGHEAELRALAKRLQLVRIHWPGPVRGDDKVALYRSADLFALPTHAENFGLVVAEALAHGVPVITTRNAPWEGLIEQRCGWWIDLDEEVLVETLREAMAKPPEELRTMGERGHAWMERNFSWDRVAEEMLDVYRWVAGQGGRPSSVQIS